MRLLGHPEWHRRDSPWEPSGVEVVRTLREKGSEPPITDDRRKYPPDGPATPLAMDW